MTQQEFFKRYTYNLREDKLGGGSFGTVYRAYDNVLDKTVAIKIAEVKTFGDKTFSLLDEFDAIKGLREHPNIANYEKVYTFEQPNGVFDYAIIQYYPDGNLSEIIKNENLSQEQKEDIAIQILDGLEFLHTHNVVHRDMKPSNILIHKRQSGRIIPKIADFGLSKQADAIAQSRFTNSFGGGTLEYSSPEQLRGQALRLNTDLWAWAVMTYELFTGKMLFRPTGNHSTGSAEREKELFEQILNKDVSQALSELPNNWQNALSRCLTRNAHQRIKTVEDIKKLLRGEEVISDVETTQISLVEDDNDETIISNPKTDNKTKVEHISTQRESPPPSRPPINREQDKTTKKSNSKVGLWIGAMLLLLIIGGLFMSQTNNGNNEEILSTPTISMEDANKIFEQFQTAKQKSDFENIKSLFALEVEKYYSLEYTTKEIIVEDVKNYLSKWQPSLLEIVSFSPDVLENRFNFAIKYSVKDKKTNKVLKYTIKGRIGFIYENNSFKINYLNDYDQQREENTLSIQRIKLEKKATSNYNKSIDYKANIIYFPEIKDNIILNYFYEDISYKKNYADMSYMDLRSMVADIGDEYVKDNMDNTNIDDLYLNQSMEIAFHNQNYISVKMYVENYLGAGTGASQIRNTYFKNINYSDGYIVSINDVLSKSRFHGQRIGELINKYASVSIDDLSITINDLFLPDEFYFDNNSITFIYPKYSIAAGVYDQITLKIPYAEIKNDLRTAFYEKIKNSEPVKIIEIK